jgi:hypothetical protein
LVSHTKGKSYIEGVGELYAENIWNLEEVSVGWRRLHNEELHNLYSVLDIIRMIKP